MKTKRAYLNLLTIASILLSALTWSAAATGTATAETLGTTWYAKPGASGDCLAWGTACDLKTALAQSGSGDEIWAAEGTYYPSSTGLVDPRKATFQLKNNLALYGGFAGTETSRDQRDPAVHITILSGDLDLNGTRDDGNSYHVVTGSGTDATAILDGFTISAGNANGNSPNDHGGGMYNKTGSPTLTNVTLSGNFGLGGGGMVNELSSPILTDITFSSNFSPLEGGGMYNRSSSPILTDVTFSENLAGGGGGLFNRSSSPILTNVTFSENSAVEGGGLDNWFSSPILTNVTFSWNSSSEYGGGMHNRSSSPILTNVTFSWNSSTNDGGGMFNRSSSLILTNVTFSSNQADFSGGGMVNDSSSLTLADVTFSSNQAIFSGGGMVNYSSSPILTDVTFSSNSAYYGAGMCNYSSSPSLINATFLGNSAADGGGGMYNEGTSNLTMINSIMWGNTAPADPQIYGSATITYSDVQGGWTGLGNIDSDPLLGPLADNGGFTLTHNLRPGSPAIDAGSPNPAACPSADQRWVARPIDGDRKNGARCDMGAVEFLPKVVFLPLVRR